MYKSGPGAPFKPPRPIRDAGASVPAPDCVAAKPPRPIVREARAPTRAPVSPATKPVRAASFEANATKRSKTQPQPQLQQPVPPGPAVKTYIVQWRKRSTKKNKRWDGDGLITFDGTTVTFKCDPRGGDDRYRVMGATARKSLEGVIAIGSFELEVDCEASSGPAPPQPPPLPQPLQPPQPTPQATPFIKVAPATNQAATPDADRDALVMKPVSATSVEVVVDPALTRALRPHQREGVAFLYECVMGLRTSGNGALLADEMGLGKTLMTIALIHTLLRQLPEGHGGVVKKVLIVCPVTLIGNWRREFKKWLGPNQVSVLTLSHKQSAAKDRQDIRNFGRTRVYNVMILGYEKVLSCQADLSGLEVDLLVCDEGHRLKSSTNKVVKVFNSLKVLRRVLLTGTPMQNDLVEFYNICNFINPGVLGTFAAFQREFLKPILRLREVNCINKDTIKRGDDKSRELVERTKGFTLRRTSSLLRNYLTPKTDTLLFCPPTAVQQALFKQISQTQKFKRLLHSALSNDSLAMINLFKKICNSPSLLLQDKASLELISASGAAEKLSGKLLAFIPLMIEFRKLGEKTVVISNYTQTLDLLEEVMRKLNMSFTRLDGATPNKQRDRLVSDFNASSMAASLVFLLSAKAGGMGLNLVGASRLILFDNDWNPAVDLQAMARIHRDGQTRPVFLYRLITAGCIDEKILQRQLMKNSLSDKFVDNKDGSNSDVFDMEDLKDLFSVGYTASNTHDLLECGCSGVGEELLLDSPDTQERDDSAPLGWMSALDFKQEDQKEIKQRASIRNALLEYNHYDPVHYKSDSGDVALYHVLQATPRPVLYVLTRLTTTME